jgi:hypothetical protein
MLGSVNSLVGSGWLLCLCDCNNVYFSTGECKGGGCKRKNNIKG